MLWYETWTNLPQQRITCTLPIGTRIILIILSVCGVLVEVPIRVFYLTSTPKDTCSIRYAYRACNTVVINHKSLTTASCLYLCYCISIESYTYLLRVSIWQLRMCQKARYIRQLSYSKVNILFARDILAYVFDGVLYSQRCAR